MVSRLTILLCLALAGAWAEQKTFEGFELLAVTPRHPQDVHFLTELGEGYADLDFWREPALEHNATVLVPPDLLDLFKTQVSGQGMTIVVLSTDVQSVVDAGNARTPEDEANRRRQATGSIIDHTNYHRYDQIVAYLNQLGAEYPDNTELSALNHLTHEGREVAVIRLFGCDSSATNPAIVVEAGIHAREWITPAANLWVIEKLLKDYRAGDATARSMLDSYDWYFVPSSNPDGYEYSHTTDRMWRKNRRYIKSCCSGVDLNRNFDIEFGTTGISTDCDSNGYCGQSAFSEPETANLRDLFNFLCDRLISYVGVHAYSQLVLVPWCYTEYVSRPDNAAELDRVTLQMTDALSNTHGRNYEHGTLYELLNYAASGSSIDWALQSKPGIYALGYELRPDRYSSYGFVLPPEQIIGASEEYFASLVVLAREMQV